MKVFRVIAFADKYLVQGHQGNEQFWVEKIPVDLHIAGFAVRKVFLDAVEKGMKEANIQPPKITVTCRDVEKPDVAEN